MDDCRQKRRYRQLKRWLSVIYVSKYYTNFCHRRSKFQFYKRQNIIPWRKNQWCRREYGSTFTTQLSTEGTWLYCDYFIWVYLVLWLFELFLCNVWACVCVGVLVICVLVFIVFCIVCAMSFVLFRLCVFILICFVCIGFRTTAT